jgi:hypothetical protein
MRAPSAQVTASACNFVHWDVGAIGSPAIDLDAGKAIVQGCTFGQEGIDVDVGEGIVSAIITGNQAPAGLRVESLAGRRAQMLANEEDPVAWTDEAKRHYRIGIGSDGDGRYLHLWHGAERIPAGAGTRGMRWSTEASRLVLPVDPAEAYTMELELSVPPPAVGPDSGLFLGGKRIAPFVGGATTLAAELPPSPSGTVRLELRCRGWVPAKTVAGSEDGRTLGVSVHAVTLRARGAGARIFDANRGRWPPETE